MGFHRDRASLRAQRPGLPHTHLAIVWASEGIAESIVGSVTMTSFTTIKRPDFTTGARLVAVVALGDASLRASPPGAPSLEVAVRWTTLGIATDRVRSVAAASGASMEWPALRARPCLLPSATRFRANRPATPS